eukprot:3438144-Rhodomonas_salina.3
MRKAVPDVEVVASFWGSVEEAQEILVLSDGLRGKEEKRQCEQAELSRVHPGAGDDEDLFFR